MSRTRGPTAGGRSSPACPRYQIGTDGELAEWLWPGLTDNHAHRHSSHLYPLWYGDPGLLADPALRAAAARTVTLRLAWWLGETTGEEQPGEMAFGLVMLGLAAARLGMAATAHRIVTLLASQYWRPSLVSTHNAGEIFNVDICGGFVALITAMLVRTGPGSVDLLPAIPATWPAGTIRGIAGCEQVMITELTWTPERIEVELTSPVDQRVTLGLGNIQAPVTLPAGRPTRFIAARQPVNAAPRAEPPR